TFTVNDANNNSTTCSTTFTVSDNTKPTITSGSNANVSNDAGVCTASVGVAAATIGDNCGVPTLGYVLSGATTGSGTGQVGTRTFKIGRATSRERVTDASGNTNT